MRAQWTTTRECRVSKAKLAKDVVQREMEALRARIAELEKTEADRHRMAGELRISEATLNSVLRAAPAGIGLVTNRVLGWTNDRIHQMTGYSGEELAGQSARILYESGEEFQRVGRVKYAQIEKQGTGTVETRWKRKDGTCQPGNSTWCQVDRRAEAEQAELPDFR